MAKVILDENYDGQAVDTTVKINSFNVCPTTQTATAAGATISFTNVDRYDWFNLEQTSSANDIIKVPAGVPVGTQLWLYATEACEVRVSTGDTINGQAATTEIAMIATGLLRLIKTTATAWVANNFAAAGTESAPVPD